MSLLLLLREAADRIRLPVVASGATRITSVGGSHTTQAAGVTRITSVSGSSRSTTTTETS